MKQLIITGDDFGRSTGVNAAIERAHREGILNTASLMIAEPAAADAVRRARALPRLHCGLHIALVQGRPMLPPSAVPDLVDTKGMFATDLVRAGFRYFFSRRARRQLEAEIRAQFEGFRATGLALDHVNAHNHMHVHPTLLSLILRIGRDYDMRAIRVPYEPSLHFGAVVVAPWAQVLRARARAAGVAHNDFIFGLRDTGKMTIERVLALLRDLPDGVSEMYFHPDETQVGNAELAVLTDARVNRALAQFSIHRIAFSEIDGAGRL